jgi:hypothetical protein
MPDDGDVLGCAEPAANIAHQATYVATGGQIGDFDELLPIQAKLLPQDFSGISCPQVRTG